MRVLAHEWALSAAGSDKVAARIASALDVDRVVTAIEDADVAEVLFGDRPRTTLWTNRLPGIGEHRMRFAPAILAAWAATDVGPVDLLISSTHFGAMGAGRRVNGHHIAYCHSPLRYAWRNDLESDRLEGLSARIGKLIVPILQRFDRRSADSVSLFLANSTSIADRISAAYGRRAAVLHPCVDVDRFTQLAETRDQRDPQTFLCFGRLVAYKRVDLAVQACTTHSLPLVVAGDGPEYDRLRAMAGPTVRFERHVSDARYLELLADAKALLFPGEEDFGIVPVEAMAAGVPVVAYGRGGALDTVIDGVTGVHFAHQTVTSIESAISALRGSTFETQKLVDHADRFRPENFDAKLRELVEGHLVSGGTRDTW